MTHEIAVIGGGPAGSAAAIQLVQAGREVCLLERKQEAHDKVCGEFISWEAGHYLSRLGLDLTSLGAVSIETVRLYDGEAMLDAALPFAAWSLSRRVLDAALLLKAEEAGVAVQRGVAVRALSRLHHEWALGLTDQPTCRAHAVFLASGKHDVRHWRRSAQPNSHRSIGLKMHLRLADAAQEQLRGAVEVHLFKGGYAGLEPIEDGKANLCFLISKEIYDDCGKSWPALLAWLSNTSSHLNARLNGALSLWPRPLAVSGVPYGYIAHPGAAVPGLFRVGDQMAVIPSFAGDGIAIALHSAALAARVHAAGGDSALYTRRAWRDFRRPVRSAQMLSALLAHTFGRRAAFWAGRHWHAGMAAAVCQIRLASILP